MSLVCKQPNVIFDHDFQKINGKSFSQDAGLHYILLQIIFHKGWFLSKNQTEGFQAINGMDEIDYKPCQQD